MLLCSRYFIQISLDVLPMLSPAQCNPELFFVHAGPSFYSPLTSDRLGLLFSMTIIYLVDIFPVVYPCMSLCPDKNIQDFSKLSFLGCVLLTQN